VNGERRTVNVSNPNPELSPSAFLLLPFHARHLLAETMSSHRQKLLEKFTRRSRLTSSEVGTSAAVQSALNELLAEGAVRKLDAYYLAGREPSTQTEKTRITQLLESKRKLFPASFLLSKKKVLKPLGRSALAELVDERVVLELPVHGKSSQLLYIHHSYLARSESEVQTAPRRPVEERILAAYRDGSTARQRRSIPISELIQRSGLTASEVRTWIVETGIPARKVQLDQGDWASASDDERAAAIEQGGRKRLYIAIEP
jgi:hypothetical protein